MARLLPFYRTGASLSGGGGGGVLGTATVWGPVFDWTALGTIAGPLRVGDFALVNDLQPGSGLARYDGTDWRLFQAVFPTVADLLAFGELINSNAIAIVGTGIETNPAYFYTGSAWKRMPDGIGYVWTQRLNWADLSTVPAPQDGDRVAVQTLGTANSSGVAQRVSGAWRLVQGRFATVADMVAFPNPIEPGAFAEVKAGGGHDDDSVTYVRQGGSWVRYAGLTAGFAWTLSSLNDFSAVGLQDGDYGVFTPSGGGRIVLRYKAACNRVGGGTVPLWVPPEAYAGTGLQIDCYAIGSENNTALAAQGLAVTQTNTGTVSSVGGYIRLNAPAVGASNSVAQLTAPTITGATKWWLTCEIRGGGTNNWAGGLFQSSAESITQWSWGHIQALGARVQPLYWTTGWAVTTTTLNLQAGGRTFPSVVSTPWLVQALAANALSDQIPTTIDGLLYSQYRRDADGAVAATNFTLTPQAVGGTAGTSAQIDLRNFYRLTWT